MSNQEDPKNVGTTLAAVEAYVLAASTPGQDLDQAGRIATALSSVLTAQKLNLEVQKIGAELSSLRRQRRSENLRFWIPVLAPLLGALAVVATLVFQIHQFNESTRVAQAAAEASQFREVIKEAGIPREISVYSTEALLGTFLKSPTFGTEAREVALAIMAGAHSREAFRTLFSQVFATPTKSDLPGLVRLSRIHDEIVNAFSDERNHADEGRRTLVPTSYMQPSNPSAADYKAQLDSEIDSLRYNDAMTSKAIANVIRATPNPQGLDLSETLLWSASFADINFGDTNLTYTDLQYCDVSGADFSQVDQFENSSWYLTKWWRAKAISPALLAYLKKQYPFTATDDYFGGRESRDDFNRHLVRLEGTAKAG